jgi:uncharacterized protein YodC (DUF2158 family)
MMADFKAGEVVQLVSGGPKMTVEDQDDLDGEVRCKWFAGAKLNSGYFQPESLRKVDSDS